MWADCTIQRESNKENLFSLRRMAKYKCHLVLNNKRGPCSNLTNQCVSVWVMKSTWTSEGERCACTSWPSRMPPVNRAAFCLLRVSVILCTGIREAGMYASCGIVIPCVSLWRRFVWKPQWPLCASGHSDIIHFVWTCVCACLERANFHDKRDHFYVRLLWIKKEFLLKLAVF